MGNLTTFLPIRSTVVEIFYSVSQETGTYQSCEKLLRYLFQISHISYFIIEQLTPPVTSVAKRKDNKGIDLFI